MLTGKILTHKSWFDEWSEVNGEVAKHFPEFYHEVVETLPTTEFYLFGSRSKTYINPTDVVSDWDFAVQYTDTISAHLYELGFLPKTDIEYGDAHTLAVFEKSYGEKKVQIALKVNLINFKLAWDAMDEDFWRAYINKRSENYLGKEAVHMVMTYSYNLVQATLESLMDAKSVL